jgi:hypothetical protein
VGSLKETVMTEPLYPNVTVKLVGSDGNAFAVLGKCKREAAKAGVPKVELDKFLEEAMSSDYKNLLATCMKWFTIK